MRESRPVGPTEVPPFCWFALYRFEWVCRDDELGSVLGFGKVLKDYAFWQGSIYIGEGQIRICCYFLSARMKAVWLFGIK